MCSSTIEEHLTLLQEGLVCVVVGGGGAQAHSLQVDASRTASLP
jgi:hypothetical protein